VIAVDDPETLGAQHPTLLAQCLLDVPAGPDGGHHPVEQGAIGTRSDDQGDAAHGQAARSAS
jgi:hypothetical protein